MKKLCCALVGIFVVGFAILWWPRLDPQMVSVMRSEASDDEMVLEYRTARPFAIELWHGVRKPAEPFEGTGIRVGGSKTLRSEETGRFASSFDLLRGEHYVRLRLQRALTLTIEANNEHVEIAAWSARDATNVVWQAPTRHSKYGLGVRHDVAYFARSPEEEEFLMAQARMRD